MSELSRFPIIPALATIVGLLFSGCPSAIIWRVRTVVVDSVDVRRKNKANDSSRMSLIRSRDGSSSVLLRRRH